MKILSLGIYAIVFCLPLYLVRFNFFGIPTTVLEAMIYCLFVFWLVGELTKKGKEPKFGQLENFVSHNPLFLIAVVLILIGLSAATFFSWNLALSLGIFKAWFVDPLLFFVVLISVFDSLKQIKGIFYSLVLSGLVVSLISLVYLVLGKLNFQGRLEGIYNSPNYLAMYLAPIFLISLGCCLFAFLNRPSEAVSGLRPSFAPINRDTVPVFGLKTRLKTTKKHILLLLITCYLFLAFFFTKSFGAWMGIAGAIGFGLIVWFIKSKNKKTAVISAVLLMVLCTGLCFVKFSSIQGRLSIDSRIEIWEKAWEVFKIHPIFGIGPGTFADYFPPYPKWGVPQPHNLYLAFLVQSGLVGFIGFVLLLIWFFHPSPKASDGKADNYRLLISMMMAYILIHGLADTTYWKNDLSVFFWLIIGSVAILKTQISPASSSEAGRAKSKCQIDD